MFATLKQPPSKGTLALSGPFRSSFVRGEAKLEDEVGVHGSAGFVMAAVEIGVQRQTGLRLGRARLLSIPRGAGKPARAGELSLGAGAALVAFAEAALPETLDKLGPVLPAAGRASAAATLFSPVSKCALCRYSSEVRAV